MGSWGSRTLRIVIAALILYLIVSRFFVSTFRVDSVSMRPGLSPADRVLASFLSFGGRVPFTSLRLPGIDAPRRGDLVVVQPPFAVNESAVKRIAEPLVNFFSLQKATVYRDIEGGRSQGFVVKRIIGMPGDTIRVQGYLVWIRPRGASQFLPETDLLRMAYSPSTAVSASNWTPSLPFSGNAAEVTLKDGEYYVLGDNRPQSSDSRSWGPVSSSRILAKIILRYWPPRDFGKL